MLIKLTGGKVFDPAHKINGRKRDIFIRYLRSVKRPTAVEKPDPV